MRIAWVKKAPYNGWAQVEDVPMTEEEQKKGLTFPKVKITFYKNDGTLDATTESIINKFDLESGAAPSNAPPRPTGGRKQRKTKRRAKKAKKTRGRRRH